MDKQPSEFARLEYITADSVLSADGTLNGFAVRDVCGVPLGELAGVLVDPAAERLRYFVVSHWRGRTSLLGLLPLHGARLDRARHAVVLFETAADAMERGLAA